MEQLVALAASVSLHDGTASLHPLARSGEFCRSRPPDSDARAVLYRDTDSALGLRKIWRAHTRRAVDAHALQRPAAAAARSRSVTTRRTSPLRAQSACSYLACPRPVPGKLLPNRFLAALPSFTQFFSWRQAPTCCSLPLFHALTPL